PERCRITGRWPQQCAHGLHPQRLSVEGVARALCDAVVVDVWVGWRRVPQRGTRSGRGERVAGKATAALDVAGVGVEVGVAATRRAPEHELLVVRVVLGEQGIERQRL